MIINTETINLSIINVLNMNIEKNVYMLQQYHKNDEVKHLSYNNRLTILFIPKLHILYSTYIQYFVINYIYGINYIKIKSI